MKTATIYCGITSAMRELGMIDAERLIDSHLYDIAQSFGGYTKQVCSGGWLDDQAKLVKDTTLRVEILLTKPHHVDQVRAKAAQMSADFGQDCVLLTLVECASEFVKPEF